MIAVLSNTVTKSRNRNFKIEELINCIAQGSTASMGDLYDLIKTDVFAYALSKIGNKQDADDILQDTFVQIYKNARQYQPKGKPMAWIITIELNLIRRYYQLKSRTSSLENYDIAMQNNNIEEKAINNSFLVDILKTLNDEEREIISLHVVSGMRHREIASLLEKPLSTVLSKYNRAIKKLNAVVKEGNK